MVILRGVGVQMGGVGGRWGVGGQNRGFLVDFEGGGPSINWQYQGRGKKWVFDGGGVFDCGGGGQKMVWWSCHGGWKS